MLKSGFGVLSDVDIDLQQVFVNGGEVGGDEIGGLVTDVEVDTGAASAFDFVVDCAGDNITRCQGATRIILVHEFVALFINESGPFATHGFGDQEGASLGVIKAGGVELNEFHVGYAGSRSPGHGHAVPSGDSWVGGVKIHAAAAARR